MNNLGWKEEFEAANKYDTRNRIVKYSVISVLVMGVVIGSVSFATNQNNHQKTNSSAQEATNSMSKTTEPETNTKSSAIESTNNESSTTPESTSAQTTSTTSQAQMDSEYKQKMDEENKQLRRQWVGDALKLSAEISNINYLTGLGDAASLKKARSMQQNVTTEAIGIGILAGLPDSTETQLKKDASQLAIKAQNQCDIALYAAESINEGYTADLNTPFNNAKDLSNQFAQKIQEVKSYQGW
ncbi:MAG: hypothetical protein PWQ10_131 [Patescibacteria group bacterium]|nr:hypothetical protein [Patescibacteria group bacterium]